MGDVRQWAEAHMGASVEIDGDLLELAAIAAHRPIATLRDASGGYRLVTLRRLQRCFIAQNMPREVM